MDIEPTSDGQVMHNPIGISSHHAKELLLMRLNITRRREHHPAPGAHFSVIAISCRA